MDCLAVSIAFKTEIKDLMGMLLDDMNFHANFVQAYVRRLWNDLRCRQSAHETVASVQEKCKQTDTSRLKDNPIGS